MINTAPLRAALKTMKGDALRLSKAQLAELLDEVDLGQNARRAMTGVKSIVAIVGSSSGATA